MYLYRHMFCIVQNHAESSTHLYINIKQCSIQTDLIWVSLYMYTSYIYAYISICLHIYIYIGLQIHLLYIHDVHRYIICLKSILTTASIIIDPKWQMNSKSPKVSVVPKMEVLYLISLFWVSLTQAASIQLT